MRCLNQRFLSALSVRNLFCGRVKVELHAVGTVCMFLVLAALTQTAALAQPAAPPPSPKSAADISVADFFRLPRYAQMSISPDGKHLAAIAPVNGRDALAVIALENRSATVVANFSRTDVGEFLWLDNTRLFFRTVNRQLDTGTPQYLASFAVDIDGKNSRNLSPDRRRIRVLSTTRDGSGDLIIGMFAESRSTEGVYRLDTRTGRTKILTHKNPGDVTAWALDRSLVPRAALRLEPRESPNKLRRQTLWFRDKADDEWQQIAATDDENAVIRPIAFDADGETLIVATRAGKDRTALYKFDPKKQTLGELLIAHPWLDVSGGLIRSQGAGEVLGVRYSDDMPRTQWFSQRYAELQAAVDKALPNTANTITPAEEGAKHLVVFSQSATDAGAYFLFDVNPRTLEKIGATREWLPPSLMAERRFVMYTARDGLKIPAWLTLPRGVDAKQLPLIVHVHGGPWVRSFHGVQWGRAPTAQFFASRGYAVLEPEPRGSLGFGAKHYRASFKQWGLAMQDDITDGALHLVKEGIVDKARMGLFGGSYGGYAVLQGLVKDPELWAAGSAFIAVTDLELLQSVTWSDTARLTDYFETDFKRRVGDRDADRAQFDATSPAKNASKIRAPLMLTMGAQDERVPIIHGTTMRDAMEKAGKSIEYHVYVDEGHGFNANENIVDFYARNERFFAKHLRK